MSTIATTPFGRRRVSYAQIQAQNTVRVARERAKQQRSDSNSVTAVNKWALVRILNEIRPALGVSDRALGVLSALLSFHPETALDLAPTSDSDAEQGLGDTYPSLVVFPSNRALCIRAHGMSESTLRRHLAALVEAGLIVRRDSTNGKRYARKTASNNISQAYGLDLSPLVARYPEFERRQEVMRREQTRQRTLRERVNLLRRDLSKRIAYAIDTNLPGPWDSLRSAFIELSTPLRKLEGIGAIEELSSRLQVILIAVDKALENAHNFENISGDASQNERHISDSNPDKIIELEPATNVAEKTNCKMPPSGDTTERQMPLPVVLDACRDIADYRLERKQITTWADFVLTVRELRPMLGISIDAWKDAVDVLGEQKAAIAVGFILQRCEHSSEACHQLSKADGKASVTVNGSPAIRSPGGYLRALTEKGRKGDFPVWPAIMAHLAQRLKSGNGTDVRRI